MISTKTSVWWGVWLLALCLLAGPAAAQDSRTDVLASGEPKLPYHTYGARLVDMLPAFRVRNQATAGSVENLEMLTDGRATLGFVQTDAYGLALRRDPERYDQHEREGPADPLKGTPETPHRSPPDCRRRRAHAPAHRTPPARAGEGRSASCSSICTTP